MNSLFSLFGAFSGGGGGAGPLVVTVTQVGFSCTEIESALRLSLLGSRLLRRLRPFRPSALDLALRVRYEHIAEGKTAPGSHYKM